MPARRFQGIISIQHFADHSPSGSIARRPRAPPARPTVEPVTDRVLRSTLRSARATPRTPVSGAVGHASTPRRTTRADPPPRPGTAPRDARRPGAARGDAPCVVGRTHPGARTTAPRPRCRTRPSRPAHDPARPPTASRSPGTPKGPGTLRCPGPSVNPSRSPERRAQVLPRWIRRSEDHLMIFVTRPDPTVRPPSRMAKPRPSSMAIGWISSTVISVLSPGMTISVPSGSVMTPVTSVVRK